MNENFKSMLTYEKKAWFGIVPIIAMVAMMGAGILYLDAVRCILVLLPAIFLVLPYEKLRHNEALAIVCGIVVVISLLFYIWTLISYNSGFYFYISYGQLYIVIHVLIIALHVYELFCSYLLFIPTDGSVGNAAIPNANMNAAANTRFCKECGAKVNANLTFCSQCGKKL